MKTFYSIFITRFRSNSAGLRFGGGRLALVLRIPGVFTKLWVVIVPLVLAYCLYWSPVWFFGEPSWEYRNWMFAFLVPWFLAGGYSFRASCDIENDPLQVAADRGVRLTVVKSPSHWSSRQAWLAPGCGKCASDWAGRESSKTLSSGASAVGDFSHELPSITVPRRKTSVIFVPRSPAGILFPSDLKVLDTHDEFLRGWLFVDSTALVDRINHPLCYRNCSYLQMGSRNRKSQSPTCAA
jgi:hypothetical protein